ncbi:MAG: hypothetical protein Q8S58_00915 [Bosea sp. (in: a-proteobacteria)]|uniref:hypothetical protein n=1 Tax=Bosea sp. (in: a-proteobacteria) TaxID=1871050 RepID=UPI002732DDCD|nr:hypothetical protein [Bosea sp. (in: a-proteobacteria)]MDP3257918.1 hypothetical protein [Bosea sp. (in: a-proteobacteria)]MDP3317663.1 hypothetical protein [Bosea sp. (in: a-proteobacteria)]
MPDEVQNYLTSEIETLRSAVFRAGALNAKTLGPAAERHLDNILRFVTMSSPLEDATYLTVTRIAAFARALYAQLPVAESEAARREALAAVDALALHLDRAARPKADASADRGYTDPVLQPLAG